MQQKLTLEFFIEHVQEGQYLFFPFQMPPQVERLELSYRYPRHGEEPVPLERGSFSGRPEINIVDLGLVGPDGSQVGASGSDKTEISISAVSATPGYRPVPLVPGEWKILAGAYKIAPAGTSVTYELTFTFKERRLFKGDLHTHTIASDGVLTAKELARRALRHGLQYLAITDHNQPASRDSLPQVAGVTLIPGVEWTHYRGHANFLGIDQPYDGPFAGNSEEEIRLRFEQARERGALITLNHPFDECCGFLIDRQGLPFDLLEIWNGPMRESNLKAVALWHSLLEAGQRLPACGGSDYHRDTPFIFLGGPTTCVYALSPGPDDILSALREGRAYITFAPDGPSLELQAGEAILGDSVSWDDTRELRLKAGGLKAGDVVRVVTGRGSEVLYQAPSPGDLDTGYRMAAPGFARVEILRTFLPGLPMLPALISNPIYFE